MRIIYYIAAACFMLSLAACASMKFHDNQQKQAPAKNQSVDDNIKSSILNVFAGKGDMFSQVGVDVSGGRVLLSGTVDEPETRVWAVEIAWKTPGVKGVINEIEIQDMSSLKDFSKDIVIAAQTRAALFHDKDINPANYTVDAINGTLYLMGTPASKDELERTEKIVGKVQGVKKILNRTVGKSTPN